MSQWKETTLGEIVTFQRGHDLPQTEFEGGEYPIISSYGILGYHNKFTALKDGVTIGRSGNSIGKPFYVESNFWVHNTTLYVKKFHNSYPKFVFYLLHIINFKALDSGSAVPSLNRNYIHPLPLSVPEYEEQKQIADVLSCLDAKIENLRRQNETLEQIAQTLFKRWFIDFEFPFDFEQGKPKADGKPYKSSGGAMIASELGDIPEGWKVGISGEIITLQGGFAFKSDDFQDIGNHGVIKIRNISDNIVDINKTDFISDSVASKTNLKFQLSSGDILIAMTGAEVAKIGVVPKTRNSFFLNQRVGLFQEKVSGGKLYIYYLFCREEYQKALRDRGSGSSAQPNISASDIEDIIIIIPNLSVVEKFANIAGSLFTKRCENLFQIQTLTKTRDALLPKLMSGQLRVKE